MTSPIKAIFLCHKSVKSTKIFLSPHGFFQAQNAPKPVFIRAGELTTPPTPVSAGEGYPLHIPFPLDALGVSSLVAYTHLHL